MRRGLAAVALVLGAALLAPRAASPADARPLVIAITLQSEINPVSASFVSDAIGRAEDRHAAALVILLDTPGGLSSSMDDIVKDELAARSLPVIVYVAPEGGRAASAGVFVTMASDYAAMAPNTNIGAATPIDSSGQNIGSDLRRKIQNDAEAKIRALARSHGRNADEAQLTVRKATSYTAQEAARTGLVERVSPSLGTLLDGIDGTQTRGTKNLTFHTANARIDHQGMPFTLRLLDILIDPNLLYVLFLGGIAGLAYEVFHPGVILPGTLGGVSLILALFGFSVVPINWAGAALIVLGIALLGAEAYVTSHGLIGLSGVIALSVGGLLLFRTPGSDLGVSPVVVVTVAVLVGGGLAVVATRVVAARRQPAFATGTAALVGRTAVVRVALNPRGQVFIEGALWQADAGTGPIEAGRTVIVRGVDGLLLHVEPVAAATTPAEGVS
ncbi:MAG TPA: nodulation protein NfeD [Gaiellales bacterium]